MLPWRNYRTFSHSLTGRHLGSSPQEKSSFKHMHLWATDSIHTQSKAKQSTLSPHRTFSCMSYTCTMDCWLICFTIESLCSCLREGCGFLAFVYTEEKPNSYSHTMHINILLQSFKLSPALRQMPRFMFFSRIPWIKLFFIIISREQTSLDCDLWQINCSYTWSLPQISSYFLRLCIPFP